MPHESGGFPVRQVGRGTIPCPVLEWRLFPLILSSGSFLSLRSLPHMFMVMSSQGKFLSEQRFPPWYSTLKILDDLISSSLSSVSLIHGVQWAPPGYPLSALEHGNFLKAASWGMFRAHLICFPSLGGHSSSFPNF